MRFMTKKPKPKTAKCVYSDLVGQSSEMFGSGVFVACAAAIVTTKVWSSGASAVNNGTSCQGRKIYSVRERNNNDERRTNERTNVLQRLKVYEPQAVMMIISSTADGITGSACCT